jgi:DNA-binding winged helix-turn-helix (wHTH) protein
MDDSGHSTQLVRFGIFEADLQSGELRKNGLKVPLQSQPFQVFAVLVEHSGELVTRDDLRQKVWPADTFVDFDHALNTSITKIRIALGDDADNPRFVETLPRRGYRFIGLVDKSISEGSLGRKARFETFTAKARWISVGGTLLALLCGVGIWRFSRNRSEALVPPIEIVPLAGLTGIESEAAFSPDGNHVAFALHASKNSGIYMTAVGSEKSLRLTRSCCTTGFRPNRINNLDGLCNTL